MQQCEGSEGQVPPNASCTAITRRNRARSSRSRRSRQGRNPASRPSPSRSARSGSIERQVAQSKKSAAKPSGRDQIQGTLRPQPPKPRRKGKSRAAPDPRQRRRDGTSRMLRSANIGPAIRPDQDRAHGARPKAQHHRPLAHEQRRAAARAGWRRPLGLTHRSFPRKRESPFKSAAAIAKQTFLRSRAAPLGFIEQ